MSTTQLPASILTRSQKKVYGPKIYTDHGTMYKLTATVRYDDECQNGHNSFAITGAQYRKAENGKWMEDSFGCIHEDIAKRFPDLAPFIKWHGMTSEGPLHYVANTVYHAQKHGPTMAWVYFDDPANGVKKQVIKYCALEEAHDMCLIPSKTFNYVSGAGYRLEKDPETAKVSNLDHARLSAIWPDATDDDLTAPGLEERLQVRLPKLLEEFRAALVELGLTF